MASGHPIFAQLRARYGKAYNLGRPVGLESGYAGPGHWENVDRWKRSARGIAAAAEALAPGPVVGALDGVLDIGCGRGVMVDQLREAGLRAWGVDLGADDVRSPWCAGANAVALPFVGPFRVVVALDLIEHVPFDLQPALWGELRRCCAALLIVTVPTSPPHYALDSAAGPRNHYLCMDPDGWLALFDSEGFEPIVASAELEDLGAPFAWGPENYPFALRPRP